MAHELLNPRYSRNCGKSFPLLDRYTNLVVVPQIMSMQSVEIPSGIAPQSEASTLEFKFKSPGTVAPGAFGDVLAAQMVSDSSQNLPTVWPAVGQNTFDGQSVAESVTENAMIPESPLALSEPLWIAHAAQPPAWMPAHQKLTAVPLGPHLQAITTDTHGMDEDSLRAFARDQGLDEQVMGWLLRESRPLKNEAQDWTDPASITAPVGLIPKNGDVSISANMIADPLLPLPVSAPSSIETVVPLEKLVNPQSLPSPLLSSRPLTQSPEFTHPGGSWLGMERLLAITPGIEGGSLTLDKSPDPWLSAHQALPEARVGLQSLNAAPQATSASLAAAVWTAHQSMPGLATPPDAASDPSVTQEAAQVGLHWRLASAASVRTRDPLVTVATPPPPPEVAERVWEIEIDLQPVLQASTAGLARAELMVQRSATLPLWDKPISPVTTVDAERLEASGAIETSPITSVSDHRGQRSGDSASHAVAARVPPGPDTLQRAEQQQSQADKMGQAIGQRILSEIEKGHWHLRMMLKPVQLGHIEVEMRLRHGELDAHFTVAQTLTRDLLQDGLGRLRDTLTQMGMDVANMQINTGFGRAGGGDSTPGKRPSSPNGAVTKDPEKVMTGPATVKERRQGPDGWDVMV